MSDTITLIAWTKKLQEIVEDKDFKVSPFNPTKNQTYRWKIERLG